MKTIQYTVTVYRVADADVESVLRILRLTPLGGLGDYLYDREVTQEEVVQDSAHAAL